MQGIKFDVGVEPGDAGDHGQKDEPGNPDRATPSRGSGAGWAARIRAAVDFQAVEVQGAGSTLVRESEERVPSLDFGA